MSGLESELHGQVRVRTVPHLAPEARAAAERFGWASHGLVIHRGDRIVYTASDHRANGYDAHVALVDELGWGRECR